MTITIKHTLAEGTIAYNTPRIAGIGESFPKPWRGSQNLPADDDLGEPYWYLPHSRSRRADSYDIDRAAGRLEEAGYDVEVTVDNVTLPEIDPIEFYAMLEVEKYERAGYRASPLPRAPALRRRSPSRSRNATGAPTRRSTAPPCCWGTTPPAST